MWLKNVVVSVYSLCEFSHGILEQSECSPKLESLNKVNAVSRVGSERGLVPTMPHISRLRFGRQTEVKMYWNPCFRILFLCSCNRVHILTVYANDSWLLPPERNIAYSSKSHLDTLKFTCEELLVFLA